MTNLARRKFADRGTTAIEFAMVGPLLVLLVLVIFEIGLQATVAAALDYGGRRASRLGITGAITANGPMTTDDERKAALRNAVLAASGGLLADARLTIEQSNYGSVAAASSGAGGASGPGGAGQVVRYQLTYVQPLLTGSLAATVLNRTQFTHNSTLVVVNEQFPTK